MTTREWIEKGEDLLKAGPDSPDAAPLELLKLARQLQKVKQFGVARRLLEKARRRPDFATLNESDRRKIHQQCALCTYKDDFRPLGARLDAAIEILRDADPLATTTNQETLGLAGSIYKRKWQADGRREHLEVSLAYYLRGHRARGLTEPESDRGYTGINAAFVLDLLATEEERQLRAVMESSGTAPAVGAASLPGDAAAGGSTSTDATSSGATSTSIGSAGGVGGEMRRTIERRRDEAITLRREILSGLSELLKRPGGETLKSDWWFLTTLGEAAFGVRDYAAARAWLLQAIESVQKDGWQRESTVQQPFGMQKECMVG